MSFLLLYVILATPTRRTDLAGQTQQLRQSHDCMAVKPCMQVVQVLSGGHGARTYQDERFSYVVMRRGPRPGPETIPDLTVARQRQLDAPDAVQRVIEAGEDSPLSIIPLLPPFPPSSSLPPPAVPLSISPACPHPPSASFCNPLICGSMPKGAWIVRRCNKQ